MDRSESRSVLAWAILSALPIGFAIWFVRGFSMSVPLLDQWGILALCEKIATGHVRLGDFFAPHNATHAAASPRIVMVVTAFLTHLDYHAETYFGFLLAASTAWNLGLVFRRSAGVAARPSTVWAVNFFTVSLLFSPVQDAIWTWSIGMYHYIVNAAFAGALWALVRPKPRLALAMLCAVAGTFSRMEGLLIWVFLFPLVWSLDAPPMKRRVTIGAWIGSAIGCGVVYVICIFMPAASRGGDPRSARGFLHQLQFLASTIGMTPSSFTESWFPEIPPTHAFFPAGILVIGAYFFLAFRLWRAPESRARALPAMLIGAFGLAFAMSAAFARSWLSGAEQHVGLAKFLLSYYLSAYSPTSALVTISVVYLFAIRHANDDVIWRLPRQRFGAAAAAAGLLLVAANYAHAMPRLMERRAEGKWDQYCVELLAYMDAANTCWLSPASQAVFERTGLRKIRSDVLFRTSGAPHGAITATESTDAGIVVSGWVALGEDAGTVLLGFDASTHFFAQAIRLRHDERGLLWTALIPAALRSSPHRAAHAWAYDKAGGHFRKLDGEVLLALPEAG